MKGPIRNLPASVQQRLKNHAEERKRPFNEVLVYYAMERFLYRLSVSKWSDRFILKGALMLVAWGAPGYRPTRDIDLMGRVHNSLEEVERVFREISDVEVSPDGMVFDPSSLKVARIKEDADYEGARIALLGRLGTMRIPIQIDIGFGDSLIPPPMDISYPSLLEFPKPMLRGYRRETTIAEKFHAMVELGELNSRMKDFHDIAFLARNYDFDGRILAHAVKATFENRSRGFEEVPRIFSPAFGKDSRRQTLWAGFLRRSGFPDTGMFTTVLEQVRFFLEPVAEAVARGEPFEKSWQAGDAWR